MSLLFVLLLGAAAAADPPAERIASLAPSLTELAFSAGAGDRIVATVAYSDHPEAARSIPRIGDAFHVDLERLLALRPDAVLAWTTGTPTQTIERIRSLDLRVVAIETNRLDDVATALRTIGQLAGTSATADAAAARFERDIGALRAQYRDRERLRVFLQVNDRPLYTVNGRQIMSEVVELCGGSNVFAELNELAPSVGIEAVIAANPQVILATGGAVADAAGNWSKWPYIEAVRTGNVYTLPADDLARATTRLTAGARIVCRTLDTARQRLRASSNR